ncbi:hypothetical protein G6Z92_06485 [Vibrio aestuarianus subsp. cardii]|uniref:hypothetical protein n=1 Tax=Vibrio aestuarianus TaxID=28171 RepID=UPI0015C53E0C|nr:hypothetical protein [Vibrio aestuarianus]NGZ66633.1 hypothetical protein [Vibrio aestuarianus subsp. cardii]
MNKGKMIALLISGLVVTSPLIAKESSDSNNLKWSFSKGSANYIQVPASNDKKSIARFLHSDKGINSFNLYVSTDCTMDGSEDRIVYVNYQKIKVRQFCNTDKFIQFSTNSHEAVEFIAKEIRNSQDVEIIIPTKESKVIFVVTSNNFAQEYKKFERLNSAAL